VSAGANGVSTAILQEKGFLMQKQTGFRLDFCLVWLIALVVSGCGHSVRPMKIASNAGSQAVAKYDANKDGALDFDELAKAPGLRAGIATIKKLVKPRGEAPTENDIRSAKITAAEIDARIQEWKARGVGRIRVACHVTRVAGNGRSEPIAGAEVRFVPEDFLGPDLPTGEGTTDASGTALISQPGQGEGDKVLGMPPGFYRVEITKGSEIPSLYNSATILGQEVAADAVGITGKLVFRLEY